MQYITGRRLLPAVYNFNAESFHWNPPNFDVNDNGEIQLNAVARSGESIGESAVHVADLSQNVAQINSESIDSNVENDANLDQNESQSRSPTPNAENGDIPNQTESQSLDAAPEINYDVENRNDENQNESQSHDQQQNSNSTSSVDLNVVEVSILDQNETQNQMATQNDDLSSENEVNPIQNETQSRSTPNILNTKEQQSLDTATNVDELNAKNSMPQSANSKTGLEAESDAEDPNLQPKREPFNNSSIICLSDDSDTENGLANYDQFDGLGQELIYNSDDDIDEQIAKEFDYLESIGKTLPQPVIVKVEDETATVSATASATVETSEKSNQEKASSEREIDGATTEQSVSKPETGQLDPVGGHFDITKTVID